MGSTVKKLLGQRLRRRHQRALLAGFDRAQERVEGDDGLPEPTSPLEQPLHRPLAREVSVDLRDRASWLGVSSKGRTPR